ncbi:MULTISPECIES: hypothetical protein [unclassified Lentimonas]|uniref:hypothetical protein n=1 Tax=unclassified Lentimonas TaxID=2630993 RepID=UPI0013231D4B|nr:MULTISPECIES: hypothetical protein [unclassified Lentimonas]CAA6696795.1 Unannotated [Lentimonas sp. CC19]CAA6697411.1 Unannotated [Lentimonas sp. CC10]CAA7071340.1 Unannotated [Lentimonas sp. CC11]
MDDTIFIDLTTTELQPGQQFSGKILWALEKAPQTVRLTLGWFTEGRGTTDHKIEAELSWTTDATSGEEPFEFTLPPSPYSFDGKLISLNWELSLSVKKGKAEHQLPITVSPQGKAVELSAVANDSKRSPLSFLKRRSIR